MKKTQTSNEDKLIAFFASLCLFLSAIEYVIPKPLPFMRLGLANMPILLSLYILKPKQTFFLVFLKVIGQGFISGTFFSYIFAFSISGSFASAIFMLLFYKVGKENIGPVGIGIIGALANAGIQVILSDILLFGVSARYIAPLLIINAVITGCLLGIFTAMFIKKSQWFLHIHKDSRSLCHD